MKPNHTPEPTVFARHLPALDDLNRPFWTGGAGNRLLISHCPACARWQHPPQPVCPSCLHKPLQAEAARGSGFVVSFTINDQPWYPGLPVPFAVAIVELDEQPGLRLTTNIVNVPLHEIHIGQRVRVVFEQHEDVWLPLFEPAGSVQSKETAR